MFRPITLLVLLASFAVRASASESDLCIPTTGRDVCGIPGAALFSRYDELYGKRVSVYLYLSYERGDQAALSLNQGDPQRSDHYSCLLLSLSESTYSGIYDREEVRAGDYYVRVTGDLVDSRKSGICFGHLKNADLNIIWRLDESK